MRRTHSSDGSFGPARESRRTREAGVVSRPLHRAVVAAAPGLACAAVVAASILIVWPRYWAASVATVLVYVGTAGGPGVAIPAGLAMSLPLLFVAVLLWLVDVSVSLFFAMAVPVETVTRRFPRVGRRIAKLQETVARRGTARWGVAGAVALWVAAPVHSGGAVIGTLGGRALGLPASVAVPVVAVAAAIRTAAWALAWGGAWNALEALV